MESDHYSILSHNLMGRRGLKAVYKYSELDLKYKNENSKHVNKLL